MPLMPWQQQLVDVALEVLPDGRWAYPTVVATVPRQAGKTTTVQAVLSHRGQMLTDGRLWLTAQNRDKARARWLDVSGRLTKRLPRSFTRNIGVSHEVLRWVRTGSELRPFAPNAESMHSESPDLVAPDEIWAFSAQQAEELQQAYLPGMITKNAQEFITSTQGTDESEWLNELTESGRALVEEQMIDPSKRRGVCFVEYSVPREVDGVDVVKLDDERLLDVICEHHPALGYTITREALAFHLERFKGDRVGYVRGYGNLRYGSSRPRVIPARVWDAARTDELVPARVGLGISVDEDGQNVAVVAAGRLESGQVVTEVVQTGPGWSLQLGEDGPQVSPVEFVQAVQGKSDVVQVATSTSGANRDLSDALKAADVEPLLPVGPADHAAACARQRAGIKALTVLHRGQPSLDDAMRTVTQRKLAGGLGWAGQGATVVDAQALAVWALDHPGEQPGGFWIY